MQVDEDEKPLGGWRRYICCISPPKCKVRMLEYMISGFVVSSSEFNIWRISCFRFSKRKKRLDSSHVFAMCLNVEHRVRPPQEEMFKFYLVKQLREIIHTNTSGLWKMLLNLTIKCPSILCGIRFMFNIY